MEVVFLAGRVLFALIFIASGLAHITKRNQMAPFAEAQGAPAPMLSVVGSGVMILVGGVLVALGLWADVGALLIVVFLIPAAFLFHAFWKIEDPMEAQGQQAHFFKNVSLIGAALIILYVYWALGDNADMSVGGPLFIK
ncbi:MAG: DoxX family protein [Solirubrobacterales bacterium]|nr:DoxX family protein [Solirubrobacterales bacterium]